MHYKLKLQAPKSFFNKNSDINPIILNLLWQRGIRKTDQIKQFLNPVYGLKKYDPYQFKEMKKAVQRILKAQKAKEKVLIYGDYDVDGVCSAIILIDLLQRLYQLESNQFNNLVKVYLPDREKEGYGLNNQAVEYIKNQNVDLLITVDCGSVNIKELKELKKTRIDVVVIDHHLALAKRPPVYAFINPKLESETYPFRELSAGGVAFKLVQAVGLYLKKQQKRPLIGEAFEKWLLDLVALSTVADVMPLVLENRILVKWGLVVLNKTKRVGLQELIKAAGLHKEIGTYEIGFVLAPRINSAGRLDHANVAFDLLRQSVRKKAQEEAHNLNQTNLKRQDLTKKIFEQAKKQVKGQINQKNKILVAKNLASNAWPVGILGLVAGKLVQEFNRPSFVIGFSKGRLSGSGRSVKKFNIMQCLKCAEGLFSKYGGHPQACGFTFKLNKKQTLKQQVNFFKKKLEKYAQKKLLDKHLIPVLLVDMELSLLDINWNLIYDLKKMKPFGEQNKKPIFITKNITVVTKKLLGIAKNHLKLVLKEKNIIREAILFRCNNNHKKIKSGDKVNVIYNLEINKWRNRKTIQLCLKNIELINN